MPKTKRASPDVPASILEAMTRLDEIAAFVNGASASIQQHRTFNTEDELSDTLHLTEAAAEKIAGLRKHLDRLWVRA